MSMRIKLYKETLREIQSINMNNKREQLERKEDLFKKFPRLEGIETELNLIGVNTMKMVAFSQEQDREEIINRLRTEQKRLIDERKEIFRANNIDEDILEIKYDCTECNDTGEKDNVKCACFTKKLTGKLYEQSNVINIVSKENFHKFNINYYSDEIDKKEGISPKENMRKVTNLCLNYVQNFSENSNKNFIFHGKTGLGKTYLCNCIAGELLNQNVPVLYLTAGQMFLKLGKERFHNNNNLDEEQQEWDRELSEIEVLIIDDLGTELSNTFTATELFRILNDRELAGLSTIISTNLGTSEINDIYSERIVSRIVGSFENCKFFGDDIRIKKQFSN